jgi:hypothetical protein
MVNIRMWGIRDGSCLLNGTPGRKSICDIEQEYGWKTDVDIEQNENSNAQRALAKKLAYAKYRKRQDLYANKPRSVQMIAMPSYDAVQRMLYNTIIDFAYHPSCNELTLQQLIDLMQIEMQLLTVFIYPTAGSRFSVLHRRAMLLHDATPSVRILFDKILSMAMYNDQLNQRYEQQLQASQPFNMALNSNDKKIFLHTAYQRIADVQKKIKRMRYLIATQYV